MMWTKVATVVTILVVGACRTDPAPAATAPPSPCLLEQRPLVLGDGTEMFVETQNLFGLEGEWMVSGSPAYQWSVGPGRDAVNVSRNEYVAAFVTGPSRVIAKPIEGRVGSVLATPLGDGRWAAIFDEAHPDSVPSSDYVRGWFYGEHDGSRWSLTETLPRSPGTALDLRRSSELIRVGDRLLWIGHEYIDGRMILHWYERRDGAWRHEPLPDEWVELVVLKYEEPFGLWMLLAGYDPELPGFQKSIRLYRDGSPRELVSRVAVVPGAEGMIYHPAMELLEDGVTVSWVVADPQGFHAFARTGIREDDPGSLLALDDNALHLYSMKMPNGAVAWVAEHVEIATQSKELRLLGLDGSRVVRMAAAPSPFTGFFRVRPNGVNEVLLVGAQMGLVATETPVRSIILRLSTSC